MGLSIIVGPLADHRENDAINRREMIALGLPPPAADEEGGRHIRNALEVVNRVLVASGLPPHLEPATLPEGVAGDKGSMPYSQIHYLRRAVGYARHAPEKFRPLAEGEDPDDDDPWDALEDSSHVICHSDCEGFYVPIDFEVPLTDDTQALEGYLLGSSQQALAELIQVAPLLGIALRDGKPTKDALDTLRRESHDLPLWRERYAWLVLYEAMRLSVEHGCAVMFG